MLQHVLNMLYFLVKIQNKFTNLKTKFCKLQASESVLTKRQVEFVLIYCHVVQFKVICVVLLWFGLRHSGKAFFSAEKHTQAQPQAQIYSKLLHTQVAHLAESVMGNVRSVPQLGSSPSCAVLRLL